MPGTVTVPTNGAIADDMASFIANGHIKDFFQVIHRPVAPRAGTFLSHNGSRFYPFLYWSWQCCKQFFWLKVVVVELSFAIAANKKRAMVKAPKWEWLFKTIFSSSGFVAPLAFYFHASILSACRAALAAFFASSACFQASMRSDASPLVMLSCTGIFFHFRNFTCLLSGSTG